MQDLLANPAFQGGVAPFIVGLVTALVLSRFGWVWMGLAVVAGFFTAVALVTGITFSPLTSTRKIIFLALVAGGLGLVREVLPLKDRFVGVVLFAAAAAAALWVAWPALAYKDEWLARFFWGGWGALYVGLMAAAFDGLRPQTGRAAAAALTFGLGTGGAALLGASALLGQLGLATGMAAAGIFVVLLLVGGRTGAALTLPAGVVGGLLGYAATVYAQLPWYALAMLALVPFVARVPVPVSGRLQTLLVAVIAGVPAAIAVFITWSKAGPPPF